MFAVPKLSSQHPSNLRKDRLISAHSLRLQCLTVGRHRAETVTGHIVSVTEHIVSVIGHIVSVTDLPVARHIVSVTGHIVSVTDVSATKHIVSVTGHIVSTVRS